jgi:TolB-like protein
MLGPFEAIGADGRTLALPSLKAQALLARLARRPGVRLARAHLAGLLWPDRPDAQGRASLRQALTAIRRAVDPGPGPTAGGDVVALPPEGFEVDVALLDAELSRAGPDPARVAELCRGPLLAGFPPVEDTFDRWLEDERAELCRRTLEALRGPLAAAARAGELAVLPLTDAALALDPAFEPAYRARMTILARSGDRAAALREYERCRAALAREVGVPPGPQTEALHRELAAGDGASRAGRPHLAPSLAILPFDVLGDDPRHQLFARGLHEDLLGALSRFRALRVIAPGSVAQLAGRASDGVETCRMVGAEYLLATTVRAGGDRMRISPRLVEAATGRQLWADRLEADAAALLDAQDRITRSIAAALALQIDASELDAALRRPPEQLAAYECWVRGMHSLRRGTSDADQEARALFERALRIAPGFARAYSGLSLSWFNDWSCSAWDRWDETEGRAYEYAREATRLDERDHVAHAILGRVLVYRREFEAGLAHVRRAVALNPNDADVLASACLAHALCGDPERALELEREARAIHPFHPDWYLPCFAAARLLARRPREAIELLERTPDLFVDGRALLAAAYAHAGELDRAGANALAFVARFERSIAYGRPFAPGDPVTWLLRVNPLRREEDRAYLVDGLARAGLETARGLPSVSRTTAGSRASTSG